MKVFPILNPIAGERVVSVHPVPEDFSDREWRRRLNNFAGRALTHTALRREQAWRDGRLAALGQLVSPGVISGLEVDRRHNQNDADESSHIYISPGAALTAAGEMITVTRPLSVPVKNIFVYDHALHAALNAGENTESLNDAEKLPTLEQLGAPENILPHAAVLVLEPLSAEIRVEDNPNHPCEPDPSDLAYENWQLEDSSRLVLYTWPDEWIPLPAEGDQWRNRIAYSIFLKEHENEINQLHPWEKNFVPIALIGFDESFNISFIDRNSVARQGGKKRRTESILSDAGNRFLWQAQFEQFNEHLADVITSTENPKDTIKNSESAFRYLPPVGVLPKTFLDSSEGEQKNFPVKFNQEFFPVNFNVEILAIPYEQLDVTVRESASLAPFDLTSPDRVQILAPVPQVYFEPEILNEETLDPEFDETIRRFIQTRNAGLGRRLDVRRKGSALNKSIKGEPLTFTRPDPDAIDDLELAAPFEKALIENGQNWKIFEGEKAPEETWIEIGFDDSEWGTVSTSVGFGDHDPDTVLEDMEGSYLSLFFRKEFELSKEQLTDNFKLIVTTNGGFAAHLNGKEISIHNLADKEFNTPATKPSDLIRLEIDLSEFKEQWVEGSNVLAIQVHNHDVANPNFIYSATLASKTFVADVGEEDHGVEFPGADSATDAERPTPVVDENQEPIYAVKLINELKTYLDDKTKLSDAEVGQLEKLGLEEFIELLRRKINGANDKVDFGFARIQTDIYRIRQFMLGNVEGTKLATSPILAGIAKGETAFGTKKEITDFVISSKEKLVTPPEGESGSERFEFSGPTRGVSPGDTFTAEDFSGANFRERATERSTLGSGIIGSRPIESDPTLFKVSREAPFIPTKEDIVGQPSVIGGFVDFRNVTVGERLKEPIASAAKTSGIATKADVLKDFLDVDIFLDDISVPGFRDGGKEKEFTFKEIRDDDRIAEILKGIHDENEPGANDKPLQDESAFYNSGVRALENSAIVLRKIEGRIHSYNRALKKCQFILKGVKALFEKVDLRLKTLGDELAEARHDLTVARALKMEELNRIDAINERRGKILNEHVPFFLFRRPRLTETRVDTPVHILNPDLSEDPLPVCEFDDAATLPEIGAMIDVIREAPLKWFVISKSILKRLNRIHDLRITLIGAKHRSQVKATKHPLLNQPFDALNRFRQGIGKTLNASYQIIFNNRKRTSAIDLTHFHRFGWRDMADRASDVLSLGDVIDGNHGRMGACRKAAKELEEFEGIASCLYLRFGQILPGIRLDWAERLSQFDSPINLSNLYNLPRWDEVDYQEREEMQALVGWLYKRVFPAFSEATDMVSDLIRVCILLASHAPVNKIISGHTVEPTKIQIGSRVDVIADLTRVRVGMMVKWQSAQKTVAWGAIEDIEAGYVSARVLQTKSKSVALEKNAKALIGEPRSLGGKQFNYYKFKF